MRLLLIVMVLALAVVGAGCGGGDDEASGDTDTVVTETTDETTDGRHDDHEETTTGDETVGDSFASEGCQDLMQASAALGAAFSSTGSGDDLDESSEAFSEFADEAPEEIREDLQTLAAGYAEYVEAFADLDINPGETPSAEQAAQIQQAFANIDLEEFNAASTRFSTWAAANC